MKRFIFAVGMLLLVLCVCAVENIYLENTLGNVSDELNSISTAYQNNTIKDADTQKLIDLWSQNERYMQLFLDHSTVDKITTEINKFSFLKEFDRFEFFNTVNTVQSLIEDIRSSEKISIDGLF